MSVRQRIHREVPVFRSTLLLLFLLATTTARGQGPSSANTVRTTDSSAIAALEQQIENALVSRNAVFLDSIYASTFRFKHSTGVLETRSARMEALRRPMAPDAPGRMLERKVDSLDVEVHGTIALTTGRIHIRRAGGEPRWQDYTIRYVRIYAKAPGSGGRWQLVTHHSLSDAQGAPPAFSPRDE